MPDSYPSIFGTGAPKFIYDLGGANEEEVLLDRVNILKDEPDLADIKHKSVKTGHKEWTKKGKHWTFEVAVHLFEESNYTNAYNLYLSLKSFKHKLVTLYKRRDGDPVMNDNDEIVLFFIEAVEERYLEHYLFPDILIIRFVSQDPVDLPIGAAPPVFETPETILECYGDSWNGTVMDGNYIGPAVTEQGTVTSVTGINSKKYMQVGASTSYLNMNSQLNANPDNYLVFSVTDYTGSHAGSNVLDFRKEDLTSYNLIIPSSVGAAVDHMGYYYGLSANNAVTQQVIGENTGTVKIRCWIFQNSQGRFYMQGGSALITGAWEPTQLGGTGYRRRMVTAPGIDPDPMCYHISVHKFVSTGLVDLDWVNAYGQALATYYGLTWNNITE